MWSEVLAYPARNGEQKFIYMFIRFLLFIYIYMTLVLNVLFYIFEGDLTY